MARERSETWYTKSWRPFAAYVYLFICLNDFVFLPAYYEYSKRIQESQYVEMALKFPQGASQIEALKALQKSQSWEPLTLQATGLFHIAFGAILGVSAWTRSRDKWDDRPDGRGRSDRDENQQ